MLGRVWTEGRADDNEQTIRRRMAVYAAETQPLLAAYRDRGLSIEVPGSGTVDEVAARITAALDAHLAGKAAS